MQLRRKVVLIVTSSILLAAVPGAALVYVFAQRSVLANESVALERQAAGIADLAMQRFSRGQPKLKSLARVLEKELAGPIRPGELAAFDALARSYADGAWRNRRAGYDGRNEAGLFLPSGQERNDEQKIRLLRIKHVMDTFGAAASEPLENVWYLSPERSEVIFDQSMPEFAFDMKADTDYTQTPWLTFTSPRLNPGREFRFTPPLFDPVANFWMVSALYPLYVNGQWIGSLGEDMQLTGVLKSLFSQRTTVPGVQHFLLDNQGNFVLAGPWQETLESANADIRPELSGEPELMSLMKLRLTGKPSMLGDQIRVQGKRYLAVGVRLEPLGWRYYSLTPVSAIMAPTRQLFAAMVVMILMVTAIAGLMIGTAVGGSITRRIKALRDVMKGYANDRRLRVPVTVASDDEIAEVALVYNEMADSIENNIARRKVAEGALVNAEELWRFALEGAGDGVWDWSLADGTVRYTKRWREMLGYAEEDVIGGMEEWVRLIHPDDVVTTDAAVADHVDGRTQKYVNEHRLRCRDGSYKWILDRGMVVSRDVEGKPLRIVGTIHDISADKQANEALQSSLKDKEALLREVHHRVKNNLQVIASLLRLESGRSEHGATRLVLGGMQGRIQSMALLHESLYRSGTFASVDLGAYLGELAGQAFRMQVAEAGSVQLQMDLAAAQVEMDQALPCGLLVNELLSNCLKHGLRDGRAGEVRIELKCIDDGRRLSLRVSDTGVGLPGDFESRRENSLGLQLVSDLAGQLHGTLEIGPAPAAVFTVTFPI